MNAVVIGDPKFIRARKPKWFQDVIRWVKARTVNRHHVVDTGLAPGWHDADEVMLHAAFSLLVKFVEEEKPEEEFDWEETPALRHTWREIQSLYKWWKEERPMRVSPAHPDDENIIEFHSRCDFIASLDRRWYFEDTVNLSRLVWIRKFLWT